MIIDHLHKDALSLTLEALEQERIFVYPTDTIYGFGGDARSEKVIDDLYELKSRSEHMPVSMLVKDKAMLDLYAECPSKAKLLIHRFLPGALTLVLPAKIRQLPSKLFSMEGYLGFRIPDHSFCHRLSQAFNAPIITTSVNLSGQPALNDMNEISRVFGQDVELLVQDRQLDKGITIKGSTVVMITADDQLEILREGNISVNEINRVIR
jgi:L-threonylcarbamoyladenylate synthase